MTLVIAVNGLETIWLSADRRLTQRGQVVREDARKCLRIETTDGVALIGYAGLGATAAGTEPCDWMNSALRGVNRPLEETLGLLCDVMNRQLPRHLTALPTQAVPAHHVIVPAFVGNEVRFYTIELELSPDRRSHRFRYLRHTRPSRAGPGVPLFAIAGSGARCLSNPNHAGMRNLRAIVRRHDRGRLSAICVARHLAGLNQEVHYQEQSVGPRCTVAWFHRRGGDHQGGGGIASFTGVDLDETLPAIPVLSWGLDVVQLAGAIIPSVSEIFKAVREGRPEPELDRDKTDSALSRLPWKPDETLN